MASTYSSLKIQLMGTGDNTGTWGNVTNTNLGTAIEEAIVGSADVSFSGADVTLTLSDSNSSQAARNMRLNLTGSVSAPQNLVVPAIEKVYIVNNTLAYTITVKNSTGTGIAVPAGKTMWVYNNGTNVVEAMNHMVTLTTNNVSATNVSATNVSATNFQTTNFTITESGGSLRIKYGATTIFTLDSSGNLTVIGDVTTP